MIDNFPSYLDDAFLDLPGNRQRLTDLADSVAQTGIIPFVGAGLSFSYGYPMWSRFLRNVVADPQYTGLFDGEAVGTLLSKGKMEEAADLIATGLGNTLFNECLGITFGKSSMKRPIKREDNAAKYLPEISRFVITTNFDPMVETVYKEASLPFDRIFYGAAQRTGVMGGLDDKIRVLVKIHGDVAFPEDRVLTKAEYSTYYGGDDPSQIDLTQKLPMLIQQLYATRRPILFLGCSLQQDRYLTVINAIAQRFQEEQARNFALVEVPDAKEWGKRTQALTTMLIRPIWFPKGEYHYIEKVLRYLKQVKQSGDRGNEPKATIKPKPSDEARVKGNSFDRKNEAKRFTNLLLDSETDHQATRLFVVEATKDAAAEPFLQRLVEQELVEHIDALHKSPFSTRLPPLPVTLRKRPLNIIWPEPIDWPDPKFYDASPAIEARRLVQSVISQAISGYPCMLVSPDDLFTNLLGKWTSEYYVVPFRIDLQKAEWSDTCPLVWQEFAHYWSEYNQYILDTQKWLPRFIIFLIMEHPEQMPTDTFTRKLTTDYPRFVRYLSTWEDIKTSDVMTFVETQATKHGRRIPQWMSEWLTKIVNTSAPLNMSDVLPVLDRFCQGLCPQEKPMFKRPTYRGAAS